jgi:tetratricopeptide (TPR) repeat protein
MAISAEARTLRCSICQEENPAGAKYCLGCGARIRRTCAQCETELPGHARFCFECGSPVAPTSAERPDSFASSPASSDRNLPHTETAAPVVLARPAVLNALYHQGLDALRRGDHSAALAALTPVVKETPNTYPDARALLDEARHGLSTTVAPSPAAGRTDRTLAPELGVRRTVIRARSQAVAAGWMDRVRALEEQAAALALSAANWQWLRQARARLPAVSSQRPVVVWGLAALAVALVLGGLALSRGTSGGSRPAGSTEAAAAPTAVPAAELFAQCEEAVAAKLWADAIPACRVARARTPDDEELPKKLAEAYVGRGEQRLSDGDLAAAAADFEQALAFQPDSTAAQSARQRLALYQEGEKALVNGQWDVAVAQLSAAHADAPGYLRDRGERSLAGLLFSAWLKWGQSASNAGDYPTAVARCSQALTLVPDDAEAQRCVDTATRSAPLQSGDE